MGIAPYNTFTFDGVSSSTYGVYLTGEGVFNAPERAVEMLSIPGRNGNYALDLGRFENISVTYKVGMFDVDESNFATKVSNFRNWLCSKVGYVRLTDTYNTGEYRMAVYKSGLELDHELLIAGEAEITFDCKPQRFLTSGETETAVANNGTINNPTLFDARPILKIQGYGNIGIAGQTVSVGNIPIGDVLLANSNTVNVDYPYYTAPAISNTVCTDVLDLGQLNTGDTFLLGQSTFTYIHTSTYPQYPYVSAAATSQTGTGVSTTAVVQNSRSGIWTTTFDAITFTKGTSSTHTHTYDMDYDMTINTGTNHITVTIAYNGTNTVTLSATALKHYGGETISGTGVLNSVTGYSTKSISGTVTIDLDIGEAYWTNSGVITSANNAVSLPAELPVLKPGNNTITYPNTLTSFKIIPNWWKV